MVRRRRSGLGLKTGSVLLAMIAAALGTFAIPIPSWRTGEVETASFGVERSDAEVPSRLWIDTDAACGHGRRVDPDDCLAVLAIARSDGIEIAGMSTVFGNAELTATDRTTRELAHRLAQTGIVLPRIARGAAGPIGTGGAQTEVAASLAEALQEEPLTILALGPLTNIAAALQDDPALSDRVERVVAVMGRRPGHLFHPSEGRGRGLLFGHGPVFSDFNFRKDPAAVRFLLSTGVPLTLIPYEVARDVLLTTSDMERLAASGPVGSWIARSVRGWIEFWRTEIGLDGFYPFDLVAARFVLEPSDFFCAAAEARVEEGWAPEWLWPIDSAGLLITPKDANSSARGVTYCPRVVWAARSLPALRAAGPSGPVPLK